MRTWMRWILWIAAILGALFGVLRYFFIEFHTVPDDPMDPRNWSNSPNLEPGDFALVWRGGPHIGDIVRCPDPTDPNRWLVARIIGTGGDRIEINENGFRINGYRLTTGGCLGTPRKVVDAAGVETEVGCSHEELGGSKHDVAVAKEGLLPMTEVKVEAGKYFLMSDNRSPPWSHDSREPEVAQRPIEECQQRLVVRLWSKKGWEDAERRVTFLF